MDKFKTAVILAGGKSSRMGFDKQLLTLNNKRLIDILIIELGKEFEEILIVTNNPEYYSEYTGLRIVSDEIKEVGPLGGVHAGLKEASSSFVYFLACDMPCVNTEYIRFMKNRIKDMELDACVTKTGERIEPLNAFYSKRIVTEIETDLQSGNGSIFHLLKKLNCVYIEEKEARKFSPDWSMFLNLNTREELAKYMNMQEGQQ